ncbi:hypothetical protein FCL51_16400 [Elizabethkingia anophelis]|nr:hypothetical protein [Elizabethkingia anophelis]MVW84106.1 hypothetical protein [Elizabethkingia anophelis]
MINSNILGIILILAGILFVMGGLYKRKFEKKEGILDSFSDGQNIQSFVFGGVLIFLGIIKLFL